MKKSAIHLSKDSVNTAYLQYCFVSDNLNDNVDKLCGFFLMEQTVD